jgi:LMBR1 domain-containing protein 1
MSAAWHAIFWLIPVFTFLLIPFSTFYYEADDGMLMAGTAYAPNPIKRSRIGQATCYTLFVVVIVGIIFAVTYLTLSDTNIPVQQYEGSPIGTITSSSTNSYFTTPNTATTTTTGNSANTAVTAGNSTTNTTTTGNTTTTTNTTNTTTRLLLSMSSSVVVSSYANTSTTTTPAFNASNLDPMNNFDASYQDSVTFEGTQTVVLQVSVGTFYAGLMAWIGWFLFALFGGIGLIALPLDMILAFCYRPKRMDAVEFAEAQLSLRERVNELVDIGELIKLERQEKANAGIVTSTWTLDREARQAAKDERQAILGFKQAVYLLEQDVDDFQAMSANYSNYNPLVPFASLLLGICAAIISTFWFIHIIVYVYPSPPWAPFLNAYFSWFDNWFPLFGTLSVAIFVVYLLFCAIKGCFKFGIRFLFFTIHPMKVGKTYMSSFQFNIGLVLLCALPVVQFSSIAFADYAAFAEIRQLFGVQIMYLQFFSYFWTNDVFIYAFMALNILTMLYLLCRPRDQSANAQALRDRLRAHKSGG